jgi:hypothetical protein
MPPSDETTVFPCTPFLKGCLYPNPAPPGIYVLDFVDNQGARRVLEDPGLTIYDLGSAVSMTCEKRKAIPVSGVANSWGFIC